MSEEKSSKTVELHPLLDAWSKTDTDITRQDRVKKLLAEALKQVPLETLLMQLTTAKQSMGARERDTLRNFVQMKILKTKLSAETLAKLSGLLEFYHPPQRPNILKGEAFALQSVRDSLYEAKMKAL